jgi:hypothetical protein
LLCLQDEDYRSAGDKGIAMKAACRTSKPGAGRAALICLGVGLTAAACSDRTQPIAARTPPLPSTSFDGRYEGTVRVIGTAVGMKVQDCETTPRIAIDVRNNRFVYVQPHPNVATQVPELREKTTPTYRATISPNGTISGLSDQTGATMTGRVSGTRMTGEVYGLLCYYSFTADRT